MKIAKGTMDDVTMSTLPGGRFRPGPPRRRIRPGLRRRRINPKPRILPMGGRNLKEGIK